VPKCCRGQLRRKKKNEKEGLCVKGNAEVNRVTGKKSRCHRTKGKTTGTRGKWVGGGGEKKTESNG